MNTTIATGLEKQLNEQLIYKKVKSSASCKINSIKGVTYGANSSRFWLLRKHINSMEMKDIRAGLPFYSWQCVTIFLEEHKQLNLVIKNENQLWIFLKFLLYRIKSVDGIPNTATYWINQGIRLAHQDKMAGGKQSKSSSKSVFSFRSFASDKKGSKYSSVTEEQREEIL